MEISTYENIYANNLHKAQAQNGRPSTAEADSSNSSQDLANSFGTDSVELSDKAREILFKSQETEQEESKAETEAKAEQVEKSPEEEKEQKEIEKLEARDREVRIHEQAHKSAGGPYAGPINYEFQTGPDGKRYAVGGHVMFSVGAESSPEASIRKADVVYKAALAPAEPSSADHNVATAAMKLKQQAQAELQEEKQEKIEEAKEKASPKIEQKESPSAEANTETTEIDFGPVGPAIITARSQMSPLPNII